MKIQSRNYLKNAVYYVSKKTRLINYNCICLSDTDGLDRSGWYAGRVEAGQPDLLHPQPPHLHHGGHSRHREAGGLQGICGHRQHAAHGRYLDSGCQIFHKSKLHTNTYCTTVTNENGN